MAETHGTGHHVESGPYRVLLLSRQQRPGFDPRVPAVHEREASEAFLRTSSYAAYLKEVEPLLAGPPQITALTPVWSKNLVARSD